MQNTNSAIYRWGNCRVQMDWEVEGTCCTYCHSVQVRSIVWESRASDGLYSNYQLHLKILARKSMAFLKSQDCCCISNHFASEIMMAGILQSSSTSMLLPTRMANQINKLNHVEWALYAGYIRNSYISSCIMTLFPPTRTPIRKMDSHKNKNMETCFSVYMLHQILVYSKLEGILQGTKLHETPIDSHFPENKNMTST